MPASERHFVRLIVSPGIISAFDFHPLLAEVVRLKAAPSPAENPLKGLMPYSDHADEGESHFPHSMEFDYLPLAKKLLKSTDAGQNWSKLAALDSVPLYIDPLKPEFMLMSTLHGGKVILRSTDGGRTWNDFHRDGPSYTARGFTYGDTPGSVIYHMFGNMARTTRLYEGSYQTNHASFRHRLTLARLS